MFNLLISYDPVSWDSGSYQFDRSRALIEYTVDEISERYKFFDEKAIEELKSFPCLFVTENEQTASRIGYITDLRLRNHAIVINFQFDGVFPPLPQGAIEDLRIDIDLGRFELSRTHWAVKDKPLLEVLLRHDLVTQAQIDASRALLQPERPPVRSQPRGGEDTVQPSEVFIVHGHDELAKLDIANFIGELGLNPIILHQQASSGRTIIEKIEHYSNVGFGIVLYTTCDVGSKAGAMTQAYRARQNVVFEHGYLIGKLGRAKVAAIVKGGVETPNDISGVVYIPFDESGSWQTQIKIELREAGYSV